MTAPQTPQIIPPYPYMPPQPPPRKRHRIRNALVILGAVITVILGVPIGLAVAGSGGSTVAECTSEIVAHPVNGTWPGCKGLTQQQLTQATAAAMAQGATVPAAAASSPAPAAAVTDLAGNQCTALDSSGYCPGNDPAPAASGPDMLTVGATETLADNNTNATEGTVTVDSVHVTTQPADPSFGSPPANGYYVIVHITAAADPAYTSGYDVNALDFYALAPGGRQFSQMNGNAMEALSSAQESTDITATLGAGQSTSGWEAFDVSRPHGEIVYAPNLDGQPLAEWRY